jgi:hypothetical protein
MTWGRARWLFLFAVPVATASPVALEACSSTGAAPALDAGTDLGTLPPVDGAPPVDAPVDTMTDTRSEGAPPADAGSDVFALNDAGLTDYCQAYATWATTCGQPQILCDGGGPPFPALCDAYDQTVNSAAYRDAERNCLTAQNCDIYARIDCDDIVLSTMQPTTAQRKLAADYCATCAPANPTCATSAFAYDADAGPMAVPVLFPFVWEFSDSVTGLIDSMCTGAALDAGGGACDQAFGNCGLQTLNAVPQSYAFVHCM